MRSSTDLRETPLLADVSGADDRGVARLCVLGDSLRGALNTLPDRELLGGVHRRALKSRAGSRLGAGALIDGREGLVVIDPPENGLDRIVAGGLLGVNDGLDGAAERGALGVNEGRDGATERGALGVNDGLEGAAERGALGANDGLEGAAAGGLNDGLEGAMEGDLPGLDGALGVDLIAPRPAPTLLRAAPRSEPPRAAITLGVVGRKPASEKPAWYVSEALPPSCIREPNQDCARRELEDPIKRTAASTTDATAVLRSFLSPATNMVVSFPSPAVGFTSPVRRRHPTHLIMGS